jgi:hypothetical protein
MSSELAKASVSRLSLWNSSFRLISDDILIAWYVTVLIGERWNRDAEMKRGVGTRKAGKKVRDVEGDRAWDAGAGCTRYRGLVYFLRLRVFGLCSFTSEWYAHLTGIHYLVQSKGS